MSDALGIVPNLREVLADRGFTQLGEAFNRPVHRLGLDVLMDMKSDEAQRTRAVSANRGVAYHHAALPADVQAEIEDAVRQGRCLVEVAAAGAHGRAARSSQPAPVLAHRC